MLGKNMGMQYTGKYIYIYIFIIKPVLITSIRGHKIRTSLVHLPCTTPSYLARAAVLATLTLVSLPPSQWTGLSAKLRYARSAKLLYYVAAPLQ